MSQHRDLPKNPLVRDGVSQRQRQLPALSPDSVQVDERDRADFLTLAYQLSEQVNFYPAVEAPPPQLRPVPSPTVSLPSPSSEGGDSEAGDSGSPTQPSGPQPQGDWRGFFKGSASVQLALISKTRTQSVKASYTQLLDTFLQDRTRHSLAPLLKLWRACILVPIEDWYKALKLHNPFKGVIKGLVKTNLSEAIARLGALEQRYQPEVGASEEDFYAEFTDTFSLAKPAIAPAAPRLTDPDIRSELDAIFQALFQVYRQIVQQANVHFDASFDRQDHLPHMALYLALLEVLQPARNDLNRMTQRHLDFFYRRVLALPARPAQPDYAHLLFELAKPQEEYRLPSGTRFKAGKDATGVELFYALDQDMVVHKAAIASLRGLFLNSREFADGGAPSEILGLLASPVANSADGLGGDFPKEQAVKAWLPFGGRQQRQTTTTQGTPAQLGLAIASDVLLLQEGVRVIEIKLELSGTFPDLNGIALHEAFEVYLSGEKEWIQAKALPFEAMEQPPARILAEEETAFEGSETTKWDGSTLHLVVELAATADPVLPYDPSAPIPYDPEVPNLPLALERPTPVLRLQLTANGLDDEKRSAYHYFRGAKLENVTVTTRVPEVRSLVVQNDLGPQDPSKPFEPFGPQPRSGASLYIGSQEALAKRLSELKLHITLEESRPKDWLDIYRAYDSAHKAGFDPGQLKITALRQRSWHPAVEVDDSLFPAGLSDDGEYSPDHEIDLTGQLGELGLDAFTQPNPAENFTPQSQSGFLRLQLDGDFLHDEYPAVLARQVLAAATQQTISVDVDPTEAVKFESKRRAVTGAYYYRANGTTPFKATNFFVELNETPILAEAPYTPVIRLLHLSYTAEAQQADCHLFWLHPFGGFEPWPSAEPLPLLPQFAQEGELLIGVVNLDPPTALPLLFQVAEATADTELRRTEASEPTWSYLRGNTWKSLSDRISEDATQGLIRSGIVHLGIPEDISNAGTTILDPSLHWIKLSVPARSRTVCHIIGLHPQAARATFTDGGNDPDRLAEPLPAGTIAKLEKPQPAVKGIEQPYPSEGGRVQEAPPQFYTRVSERLRHKGRAVTIFDYERLVLENFPDIYKVRCLNHGQFDDQTNALFELAPGAVTLAVLPDLSQRPTLNDLQPKVNINRLQAIEDYLTTLASSWSTIKVVNPQYEPIQVTFEVKFRSPYDANFGFYRRELDRAIASFLTPWTLDQAADINFGGRIYRSSILNFVEEQDYVDYVTNFRMTHLGQDVREAIASTARSVLTSVPPGPAQGHGIAAVQATQAIANLPVAAGGLGYEPLDELELDP